VVTDESCQIIVPDPAQCRPLSPRRARMPAVRRVHVQAPGASQHGSEGGLYKCSKEGSWANQRRNRGLPGHSRDPLLHCLDEDLDGSTYSVNDVLRRRDPQHKRAERPALARQPATNTILRTAKLKLLSSSYVN